MKFWFRHKTNMTLCLNLLDLLWYKREPPSLTWRGRLLTSGPVGSDFPPETNSSFSQWRTAWTDMEDRHEGQRDHSYLSCFFQPLIHFHVLNPIVNQKVGLSNDFCWSVHSGNSALRGKKINPDFKKKEICFHCSVLAVSKSDLAETFEVLGVAVAERLLCLVSGRYTHGEGSKLHQQQVFRKVLINPGILWKMHIKVGSPVDTWI